MTSIAKRTKHISRNCYHWTKTGELLFSLLFLPLTIPNHVANCPCLLSLALALFDVCGQCLDDLPSKASFSLGRLSSKCFLGKTARGGLYQQFSLIVWLAIDARDLPRCLSGRGRLSFAEAPQIPQYYCSRNLVNVGYSSFPDTNESEHRHLEVNSAPTPAPRALSPLEIPLRLCSAWLRSSSIG